MILLVAMFAVPGCVSSSLVRDSNSLVERILRLFCRKCTLSQSDQIKNIGRKIFIKCSLFIAYDSLYCTKLQNPEYNQLEQKQSPAFGASCSKHG